MTTSPASSGTGTALQSIQAEFPLKFQQLPAAVYLTPNLSADTSSRRVVDSFIAFTTTWPMLAEAWYHELSRLEERRGRAQPLDKPRSFDMAAKNLGSRFHEVDTPPAGCTPLSKKEAYHLAGYLCNWFGRCLLAHLPARQAVRCERKKLKRVIARLAKAVCAWVFDDETGARLKNYGSIPTPYSQEMRRALR
ncbi:hypothetical protein W97_08402 [Coniosporium apollinis CBS 100218]|uniref:Uncharacterized protein n=1 Tax=Coniosporium apollinis (strain CBS 100218) TaxID=1168221 RepID=R7Z525_CONA1|nr:uncharacterized protein W97_08402 [Coniosporium apollinis CBS 100218]EON69089.1 hypothetical protein W97_08402 [Coniosporium apollinis CBS 100218]